jgi:hypothetical protein
LPLPISQTNATSTVSLETWDLVVSAAAEETTPATTTTTAMFSLRVLAVEWTYSFETFDYILLCEGARGKF